MRTFIVFACLTFIVPVVACSTSDETKTTAEDLSSVANDVCEAYHSQDLACGGENAKGAEKQLQECKDVQATCMEHTYRQGAIEAYRDCLRSASCVSDDLGNCSCTPDQDECFVEAARAFAAEPGVKDYGERCMARFQECRAGEDSFADDNCFAPYLRDDVRDALLPCFELGCAEVRTCIKQTLEEKSQGTCKGLNY